MASKKPKTQGDSAPPARRPPIGKIALLLVLIGAGCVGAMLWQREPPVYGYKVLESLEHDPNSFVQGLLYHDGFLYESSGKYGRSKLRKIDPKTGMVLNEVHVPSEYFAEGLALVGDHLYQLTWKEQTARVYKLSDFELVKEMKYRGEGWGLTYDGKHLILSDGTQFLRFLDPKDLKEVRRLEVMADGKPLEQINELEMIEGELWANVWKSDKVARIDLKTGKVTSWVDFTGLHPYRDGETDKVLNGIAYDPKTKRLWMAGKWWNRLYRVEVTDEEAAP